MLFSDWHSYDHYGLAFVAFFGTLAAVFLIQWVMMRSRWAGWRDGALAFQTPDGERLERPEAVILALGGVLIAAFARSIRQPLGQAMDLAHAVAQGDLVDFLLYLMLEALDIRFSPSLSLNSLSD